MNILLINYEYPPIGAGAAGATYNIASKLVKLGHSVTIFTSQFRNLKGISTENEIEVVRCRSIRRRADQSNIFEMMSFLFAGALGLSHLLKKRRFENSIVFFSFPCGPLGLLGRYLAGNPYVISLRGGDVPGSDSSLEVFHRLLRPLRRLVLRNSRAIIANSPSLKELAEKADPFKVKVIPNGVDTDFFVPVQRPRKEENRPLSFLYVGRLQAQKNLPFLLDGLHNLRQSSNRPFLMHMVGNGPDRTGLQSLAAKLDLDDVVVWHGWLSKEEVRNLYQSADAFVNPSLGEGMPNAVLEAMACGLPVVASNVAGNDALVQDGKTGFLFDLRQGDGLLQSLKAIVEAPEQTRAMGLKGRERVQDRFSWETVAREYLNCFCDR